MNCALASSLPFPSPHFHHNPAAITPQLPLSLAPAIDISAGFHTTSANNPVPHYPSTEVRQCSEQTPRTVSNQGLSLCRVSIPSPLPEYLHSHETAKPLPEPADPDPTSSTRPYLRANFIADAAAKAAPAVVNITVSFGKQSSLADHIKCHLIPIHPRLSFGQKLRSVRYCLLQIFALYLAIGWSKWTIRIIRLDYMM